MNEDGIQARIERERNKLHVLTEKYNGQFGHPRVIHQSMILDELINQYYQLHIRNIKKPIA
ncbi:aspartyl-phosphate phosphatase Spo0E family protein [Paenibacillus macerans]|uniref:aspartyl-phosphate phosphatase Spo0E family protein n=1 Tax=Paenibacillus macerans TaxID=44252 RepID=UPI002DB99BAA|nr:aspartyl-phosphate phosphatase Spo0E family protein [Paenibacillus macerans]MEC0330587.1 aspartyl-phosphate phosphatase Spo0E family protein [Paenibacillus macerans]